MSLEVGWVEWVATPFLPRVKISRSNEPPASLRNRRDMVGSDVAKFKCRASRFKAFAPFASDAEHIDDGLVSTNHTDAG